MSQNRRRGLGVVFAASLARKAQTGDKTAAAETPPKAAAETQEPPAQPVAKKRPQAREASHLEVMAVMLVVVGLLIAGYALAQPAKAMVGQMLLDDAWRRAQAAAQVVEIAAAPEAPAKPWSWADMAPVAEITFPTLDERYVVVDGVSGEALAWAPGLSPDAADLGAPGVTLIAAHRDTHFQGLDKLGPGAPIEVATADGRRLRYEVAGAQIVDSRVYRLPPEKTGPDVLALSTCWPIGSDVTAPERLIVFALPIGDGA